MTESAAGATRFANLALGLDAALCNVAGLVFTLTGAWMADGLGVPGWAATVFGVALLFWSFTVTLFANRRVARRHEVGFVMWANLGFVVAALVVVAVPGWMTTTGKTLLGAAAIVVGGFALAQWWARRTLAG